MKLNHEYLSDEELEQLILDVEEHELVTAPPELFDRIMEGAGLIQESNSLEMQQNKTSENKIREFRQYCFRVLTSVAAAVFIVFALPKLPSIQLPEGSLGQDMAAREDYLTREEALDDTGFLTQILGGTNIFDNDKALNIFK